MSAYFQSLIRCRSCKQRDLSVTGAGLAVFIPRGDVPSVDFQGQSKLWHDTFVQLTF